MYLVDRTVLKVKGVINSQKPNSSWRLPDLSLVYSYWTHKDKALNGHGVLLLPQLTLPVDDASL